MRRAVLALALAGLAAAGQSSVRELIGVVEKGIQAGESDGRIAREVKKFKLNEALDEHVVEELESRGAGAKTVEQMEWLREASGGLPTADIAGLFPEPEQPSAAEQHSVLQAAARYALTFSDSLPDFFCEQTVRRFERLPGKSAWDLRDTLTVKLSYFDREESYKLTAINGRTTYRTYESMRGALSKGEFASMLLMVFDPDVRTQFWWDHWTTLRKRVAHVYAFRVAQGKSNYHLTSMADGGDLVSTVVGELGFVYIDRDSGRVLRVIDNAVIPPGFPVVQAARILDYDFTDIAGKTYLLPLHADIRMSTERIHTRNVVEFSGYRKFTGESTITFK